MKTLLDKNTRQPYVVVTESDQETAIAPLKNFHFGEKEIFLVFPKEIEEHYVARDFDSLMLLTHSLRTINDSGEILVAKTSYTVEVKK